MRLLLLFLLIVPIAYGATLNDQMTSIDWSVFNATLASKDWYSNISTLTDGAQKSVDATVSPLSVETSLVEVKLHPGDSKGFSMTITNGGKEEREVGVSFSGKLSEFVDIEKTTLNVLPGAKEAVEFRVEIPVGTSIGVYTGEISVRSSDYLKRMPSTIMVIPSEEPLVDVKTHVLAEQIESDEPLVFLVDFNNIGGTEFVNITVFYSVFNIETEKVITSGTDSVLLYTTSTLTKNIQLPVDARAGKYTVEIRANYSGHETESSDYFEVVRPIPWGLLVGLLGVCVSGFGSFKLKQRYDKAKKERARYISPLHYAKLPEKSKTSLFIGKIAEANNKTYLDMNDLLTHMLIAGGTGFGKTVAAMDIAEEALRQKIPVVVFDPTLQWTGFLKACKDERMLSLYKDFGMNKDDAMPFKGSIIEVDDPTQEIDLDTYMRPGEITVFALGKLDSKELDSAVQNIVDNIFRHSNKESSDLRCVLVFDEVHRLLPKYGGIKGYASVENAIREFRRFGLGVILVSQVLSDFKATIHGNIGTEIQMKTKYDGDLLRVERKYGKEYAQTLVKEVVGVGMVQNSRYNNGKPYFVHFRPLLHSTERIPEKELQEHSEFVKALASLESKVKLLKERGMDTYEFDLELNLAKDKLKQGYASMAKIYLESAQEKISVVGG